ncbi:MAG: TolC family protein [Bacteroidetes bacterium]|nr:TolC family protein [Bacteroidota bacterium]
MKITALLGLLFVSLLCEGQVSGQQTKDHQLPLLRLEDVIELTLSKNYGIRIARNDSAALAIEKSFSQEAVLPRLNAATGLLFNNNDQHQKFSDGAIRERKGIQSANTNASLALNWTVFNGLRVYATRERAAALQQLGQLNVRNNLLNTVAEASNGYYAIVQQKQQLKAIEEQIQINQERVKLADYKLSIGAGTRPDLLQSKVDLNAQKAAQLEQLSTLQQLKNELNTIMGRSIVDNFEVTDSIPFKPALSIVDLQENLDKTNLQLLVAQKNISLASSALKIQKADRWPMLNFNSTYNFNLLDNKAVVNPFQPLFSRNNGFNYGITTSIPLFNNGITRRNIQQAQLNLKREQLVFDNQKQQVDLALVQAYNLYQAALQLLRLEEENMLLARENVQIVFEVYRLNSSTLIQLKEAQKSLQDAFTRLIRARFQAKQAETELLRLKGTLLH